MHSTDLLFFIIGYCFPYLQCFGHLFFLVPQSPTPPGSRLGVQFVILIGAGT